MYNTILVFRICAILIISWSIDNSYSQSVPALSQGLQFIENKGQLIDVQNQLTPDLLFSAELGGVTVYLSKNVVSYVLSDTKNTDDGDGLVKGCRVDMEFAGADPRVFITAEEQVQSYYNYYFPHCARGITYVKAYKKIIYHNIYPHIDIVFYEAEKGGLEYNFIVKPGGSVENIRLKYTGAERLYLINEGQLQINTAIGNLNESLPAIYQSVDQITKNITGNYILKGNEVTIQVEDYNKNYALIIDPWVTYFGGTGGDAGQAIATDNAGNILITGATTTSGPAAAYTFPVTPGAFQSNLNYGTFHGDLFISKFDSQGNLLWSTLYGGPHYDQGNGVATDSQNNVIITGWTNSVPGATFATDFPVTVGAYKTTGDVLRDAFLLKFDPSGVRIWATFFGGGSQDEGNGVAVDAADNIVFTGFTKGIAAAFPATVGQTVHGGGTTPFDAFVAKFGPNGNFLWATFYGGSGDDQAYGITTDNNSDILITGRTASTNLSVPNAFQPLAGGGSHDGFISKFNSAGIQLWGTYIGGNNLDWSWGIAADGNNHAIISGETISPDFPATPGAFQTSLGPLGFGRGFVVKYDDLGNRLWGTYLGGTDYNDQGRAVAVDADNNIYVDGNTTTSDFPVTPACAYQSVYGGGALIGYATQDAYLTKFDPNGNLIASTYLGGTDAEKVAWNSLAVFCNYVYITGGTPSPFPVTSNAYQPVFGGSTSDIFIAQLCKNMCEPNTILHTDFTGTPDTICIGDGVNFIPTVTCDSSATTWQWFFPGGNPSTASIQNPTNITYSIAGTYSVTLIATSPCWADTVTKPNYVVVKSSVTVNNATICSGQSATLTALGGGNYSWSTGATTTTITVSPTATATYSVTSGNGSCTGTTSATVTVTNGINASITGSTVVCIGNSTILTASGGTNYLWNTGETTSSINISPSAAANYSVMVSIGSCTGTANHSVAAGTNPVANAAANVTISQGQSATLTSSGGGTYLWNNGSTDALINVSPLLTTTYCITVTAANGCTDDTCLTVTVIPEPPLDCSAAGQLYLPNAFSPNGDEENDVLKIYFSNLNCIKTFKLTIYDRWGEKVFETTDPGFTWDGTYKEKPKPENTAVFSYYMKAILISEEEIRKKGNISLIR